MLVLGIALTIYALGVLFVGFSAAIGKVPAFWLVLASVLWPLYLPFMFVTFKLKR